MSKGGKTWMWSVGRVILAVVLLVAVFKWSIKLSDTVTLSDGTQVRGKITELTDTELTLRSNGTVATYPLSDVATTKDGTYRIEQGLFSILKRISPGDYIIGLFLLASIPVIATVRWQMLLRAQNIRIGFWRATELTLIGLFFNNFMPGLTGGDLVKAFYAAKLTSEKKTHAVVTVFLDRIIGMIALGIVAAGALIVVFIYKSAAAGGPYRTAVPYVAAFVLLSVAGGLVFYSRRLRAVCKACVSRAPGYERVCSVGAVQKCGVVLEAHR